MRLYECRKEYLRQSSQQILEIATLRGDLVKAVIESLSKMAAVTDEPNHCACIWQDMHSALLNWKKWLIDVIESGILLLYYVCYNNYNRIKKHVHLNSSRCRKSSRHWKTNTCR